MTPDIAISLVSYQQMVDSRCRELILVTGAIRSAGVQSDFDKVRDALWERQRDIDEKVVETIASRARVLSKKARETQ
ncbi:hypothetical protein F5B18DRAFT_651502 [Nemania serpens]|nr:hypothetical protein F5B18DRAFT_651502 [Nemania serpens]